MHLSSEEKGMYYYVSCVFWLDKPFKMRYNSMIHAEMLKTLPLIQKILTIISLIYPAW